MNLESLEIHEPYTAIIDMGGICRLAAPEKDERSPNSDEKFKWKDHGERIASKVFIQHPNANKIKCVNDHYESEHTAKDDHDRDSRAKGYGHISNEFFKPDDTFPSNQQLSKIRTKSANKSRLQKSVLTYLKK